MSIKEQVLLDLVLYSFRPISIIEVSGITNPIKAVFPYFTSDVIQHNFSIIINIWVKPGKRGKSRNSFVFNINILL